MNRDLPDMAKPFNLVWRVKTRLAERKGQKCRMLIRARRMNSCLIEFEDGYTVITSVNYVRKWK